jgi:hypothetical protein
MYNDLVNHSAINVTHTLSKAQVDQVKNMLGSVAPDYFEFIIKFGRIELFPSGYTMYNTIFDLGEFVEDTLGGNGAGVQAWAFGDDRAGTFAGLDKKTGLVVEFSVETGELEELGLSFNEFLRRELSYCEV